MKLFSIIFLPIFAFANCTNFSCIPATASDGRYLENAVIEETSIQSEMLHDGTGSPPQNYTNVQVDNITYCNYIDITFQQSDCYYFNNDGTCGSYYYDRFESQFESTCHITSANEIYDVNTGQIRTLEPSDCVPEQYFDYNTTTCEIADCPYGQIPDSDYDVTALCHDIPIPPVDNNTTNPDTNNTSGDTSGTTGGTTGDTGGTSGTGGSGGTSGGISGDSNSTTQPIDYSGNTDISDDIVDVGNALHFDLNDIKNTNQQGFDNVNNTLSEIKDMNKNDVDVDSSFLNNFQSFTNDIQNSINNVENAYVDIKSTIQGDYTINFQTSTNCTIHFNVFDHDVAVNMCRWSSIIRPYIVFIMTVYFLILLLRLHLFLFSKVYRSVED